MRGQTLIQASPSPSTPFQDTQGVTYPLGYVFFLSMVLRLTLDPSFVLTPVSGGGTFRVRIFFDQQLLSLPRVFPIVTPIKVLRVQVVAPRILSRFCSCSLLQSPSMSGRKCVVDIVEYAPTSRPSGTSTPTLTHHTHFERRRRPVKSTVTPNISEEPTVAEPTTSSVDVPSDILVDWNNWNTRFKRRRYMDSLSTKMTRRQEMSSRSPGNAAGPKGFASLIFPFPRVSFCYN